jgi:hypothetical protein
MRSSSTPLRWSSAARIPGTSPGPGRAGVVVAEDEAVERGGGRAGDLGRRRVNNETTSNEAAIT